MYLFGEINNYGISMMSFAFLFTTLAALSPSVEISKNNSNSAHAYSDAGFSIDCASGFETLKKDMLDIEGIEQVTETEMQIAYMAREISYTLTKPSHYAHPMIVRRDIVVGDNDKVDIKMAGCGYNTKENSDRLMQSFTILNQQYLLQQKVKLEGPGGDKLLLKPDAPNPAQ